MILVSNNPKYSKPVPVITKYYKKNKSHKIQKTIQLQSYYYSFDFNTLL